MMIQKEIKSLPAGSSQFTKTVYDSLGRQTIVYTGYGTDATYADVQVVTNNVIMEQAETTYDAASHVIQVTSRQRYHNASTGQLGALIDPSTTPKARVTYAAIYPDALGRGQANADYGTNGGSALSRSSTIPARSDNCLVTSTDYNADGEAYQVTDPMGTVALMSFDDAGRRISLVENYKASSSSSSSSSSNTCASGDDTNRTTQFSYSADGALATLTAVNSSTGNQVTTYTYGTTLSNSSAATSQLLRQVQYPDSSGGSDVVLYEYNRQSQTTKLTDQLGNVHQFDFDKLGRQTQDRVTALGSGVDTAVKRIAITFEVRGLVQNATTYDNATVGSGAIVNDVQRVYNTFGQLTAEYQSHSGAVNTVSTAKVQYGYASGLANTIRPTTLTYPNGRVLNYDYGTGGGMADSLSRIGSLIDNDGTTHLPDYSYLGAGAFVETDLTQPDLLCTLVTTAGGNDPDTGDIYRGLDRFGRVKDLQWRDYGAGADSARIKHGYDRAGNRLYREDPVAASYGKAFDELYLYDGSYRLRDMKRGTLNAGKTAITGGTQTFGECWTLDTTGNWRGFREDSDGNGAWDLVQSRSANPVNEITGITNTTGSAWANPAYNAVGNMTTIPQPADPTKSYTATYNAWNMLVKLVDGANTVQENAYDALRRRTVRKTYTAGVLSETRHFYYTAAWQIVEERLGTTPDSANPNRQFVWGLRYIDDLLLRDRDTDGNGSLDERLYGMQDPNWNVIALANTAGDVQERYSYVAYGTPDVLASTFSSPTVPSVGWESLYTGQRCDTDSLLYLFRTRVLHPRLGGWLRRDFPTFRDSLNTYEYCRSRPILYVDPNGKGIANCCRADQSKFRCFYVFTWTPRGFRNMAFGHTSIALDPDGPVYGFHGRGWLLDLSPDGDDGDMIHEAIRSVYKCCCLTEFDLIRLRAVIRRIRQAAEDNVDNDPTNDDPTDLHRNRYTLGTVVDIDSPDLDPEHYERHPDDRNFGSCSGQVARVARTTGCANLQPGFGITPSVLEQHLQGNRYCEETVNHVQPEPNS